jgi:hypothetical protein
MKLADCNFFQRQQHSPNRIENHDYMAGNMDKVLETLADPAELIEGKSSEILALREYPQTNITRKTAVVVYREQPDGFVITAFFTSRPDKIRRKEQSDG